MQQRHDKPTEQCRGIWLLSDWHRLNLAMTKHGQMHNREYQGRYEGPYREINSNAGGSCLPGSVLNRYEKAFVQVLSNQLIVLLIFIKGFRM